VYPMQTINYQTYWQQISLPAGLEPAIIKESTRQVWFPIPAGFEPTLQNPRHTLRDTLAHRCTSMYKLCGSCGYSISLPEWIIMEKKLRKHLSAKTVQIRQNEKTAEPHRLLPLPDKRDQPPLHLFTVLCIPRQSLRQHLFLIPDPFGQ